MKELFIIFYKASKVFPLNHILTIKYFSIIWQKLHFYVFLYYKTIKKLTEHILLAKYTNPFDIHIYLKFQMYCVWLSIRKVLLH